MAFCYFGGLACSVVLPGLAGGALTATGVAVTLLLTLGGSEIIRVWCIARQLPEKVSATLFNEIALTIDLPTLCARIGIIVFAVIGLLWGGVSVARCGLYQDYLRRIKHFASILIPVMLLGGLLGLCLPRSQAERLLLHWSPCNTASINPNRAYEIVLSRQHCALCGIDLRELGNDAMVDYRIDVVRLADNVVLQRIAPRDYYQFLGSADPSSWEWYWVTDQIAVGGVGDGIRSAIACRKLLYHLNTGRITPLTFGYIGRTSPDGRLAFWPSSTMYDVTQQRYVCPVDVCNLESGHTTTILLPLHDKNGAANVWWESNDTIAYHSIFYGWNASGHPPVYRMRVPKF